MNSSNIALQLCSDSLMSHFQQQFLSNFQICPWSRELGKKDKLQFVKDNVFSAIFVDADLSYSKENLLCWIRALRAGGGLLLESTSEKTPEMITELFPECLTFHHNDNANIWIFTKKISNFSEVYTQLVEALDNDAPIEHLLPLLDKMEYMDPSSALPCLIRSILLRNYPSIVEEYWQYFVDRISSPTANVYRALNTIINGNYQKGFKQREQVLGDVHLRRTPTPPSEQLYGKRWKGENLSGKTIIVWTEFGLGDEIMFSQLAYYFKTQGVKKVKWIAQSPIVSLLSSHPDIDQVIDSKHLDTEGKILGEFDYWAYPHEILAYVDTPFPWLPKRIPYLFAKQEDIVSTEQLFSHTQNLKVGIVWRGNPTHENDEYRSIHDLSYIETLFKMENIDWYCLQKDCNEQEVLLLEKYHIPQLTKNAKDFAQTAAMLSHLDCLVTVDTSIVHLAGAMGIQSLLMLPYIPDWRWGLVDSTNLWYPSVQIFRCKTQVADWKKPIQEIQKTLIEQIKYKYKK